MPAVERTGITKGLFAAKVFANVDEHGVVLVVEGDIMRQVLHEKILELIAAFFKGRTPWRERIGIGVDDKDRLFASVEKNGVRGLPMPAVFCVRIAPTEISNGLSPGHQWRLP